MGEWSLFREFKLQKNCYQSGSSKYVFRASWNDSWVSTCYLQLARMTSCKTDFLCTLPANRKTNKWKPTTKKGLEHSFSVRFYTKAPKKRQPLKVYLQFSAFDVVTGISQIFCWMFSFEIFQLLEGFLEKIVSRKSRSIHSHFKISQNVERLESGHFFSRLELLKCFFRAWNCLNVS